VGKQNGIAMVVLSVILLFISLMTIGDADYGKWFPFFLVGGVALGWLGFKKMFGGRRPSAPSPSGGHFERVPPAPYLVEDVLPPKGIKP